jgi:hypothetical protein
MQKQGWSSTLRRPAFAACHIQFICPL